MSIVIEGMFRFTVPSGLRRTKLGKRIRPPLDRPDRTTNRLLKNFSESFDGAQDERRGFDIIEDFPFMLINMKAMYSVTTVIKITGRGGKQLWNISHWTFIRSIPGHE